MTTSLDGREERGDRTRAALLSAARQVFAEAGFAGASVRRVAAAAGVHAALVRYHFGSKADLWARVVEEAMTGVRARLLAAVALAGPGGIARAVVGAYLDHLEADPAFPRLVVRGLLDRDEVVLSIARDHLRPLVLAAPEPVAGRVDEILTVFGAAVAPFLYAPLLVEAFGEDPLDPAALERRRAHLIDLVETMLDRLETG